MQDNAPIHKAGIMEEWLEFMHIQVAEHPVYPPDLNANEHVWVQLKKRLQEQYAKIAEIPEGKQKVNQLLAEILPLVWKTIPEEFFENPYKSMLSGVEAVIQAKGWYTKY